MVHHSILVLLDQSPQYSARSQAAMRPARALDCHLQGVAPVDLRNEPVSAQATTLLSEQGVREDIPQHQAEQPQNAFAKNARRRASSRSMQ